MGVDKPSLAHPRPSPIADSSRCDLADLGEGHALTLLAGEHTLKGSRISLATNRRVVLLQHVLEGVARVDSQSLANLSWNRRLALSGHCGMLHRFVLAELIISQLAIIPYFGPAGRPKRCCTSHSSPGFRGSAGSVQCDGRPAKDGGMCGSARGKTLVASLVDSHSACSSDLTRRGHWSVEAGI
jgi:hypothetical protein